MVIKGFTYKYFITQVRTSLNLDYKMLFRNNIHIGFQVGKYLYKFSVKWYGIKFCLKSVLILSLSDGSYLDFVFQQMVCSSLHNHWNPYHNLCLHYLDTEKKSKSTLILKSNLIFVAI